MKKTRKLLLMLLCIVLALGSLVACGKQEGGSAATDPPKETKDAGEDGKKDFSGRTFDTLLSVGGGGNYWEPVLKRLQDLYPGLTVNHTYESGAGDILRTRILSNSAPDIFNINQGELPPYNVIKDGLARPIDDILELPTMDGSAKLSEILDMGIFALGLVDGKHYIFHEMLYLSGLWYDKNFFKENDLSLPKSWDELMSLGEKLKGMDTNLLGACGLMSHEYPTSYWFWPMVATNDWETYSRLQNLDYEAFKDEGMQKIVDKMVEVRDKGYFNAGTLALGNAETQMSFIAHDFALLPCGSWLEAEMADAWTDDWELGFLPYSFGDKAGDKQRMCVIGLISMVSKTTKNEDIVGEFYRLLFSDKEAIRGSVGVHHNAMAIKGFSEIAGDLLDPSVAEAVKILNEEMEGINIEMGKWYTTISKEIGNMIVALMGGDIEKEEFLQRGYDLFKGIAEDDNITKYKFEG
ncbi:MAG: extracellular solute-binding protein [Clostridiaceae bacterium]|nr:extracellular solute-binding protein [Clostridiaceae bacterium]